MKTRTFIGISLSLVLMALVGMTGCNNGDNPVNDPEQNDIIDNNDNNPSCNGGTVLLLHTTVVIFKQWCFCYIVLYFNSL